LPPRRKVNIASIGYHFDNKEGLLSEVYRRHCEPLIEERLRGLAAASQLRGKAKIKAKIAAIIEAFIRPALAAGGGRGRRDLHPVARRAVRRELRAPGEAGGGELRPVEHRLHRRVVRCLPHLSRTDVCWRFHFLLGTIYYTAAGPHRISAFSNGRCDPSDTEAVIDELVPFMTRAFQAPPTRPKRPTRKK